MGLNISNSSGLRISQVTESHYFIIENLMKQLPLSVIKGFSLGEADSTARKKNLTSIIV